MRSGKRLHCRKGDMSKKRQYDISNLDEELEILVAHDYDVVQFSPYHVRINDRLDIWPTQRTAYDFIAQGHGEYQKSDIVSFVLNELPHECPKK